MRLFLAIGRVTMRFLTLLAQEKKKYQKRNSKTAPELVNKKKEELIQWLEAHGNEIELGELVVLFQDEGHLFGKIFLAMFGARKMK
jgi:hypothetical protein